jgi:hypothetical protein
LLLLTLLDRDKKIQLLFLLLLHFLHFLFLNDHCLAWLTAPVVLVRLEGGVITTAFEVSDNDCHAAKPDGGRCGTGSCAVTSKAKVGLAIANLRGFRATFVHCGHPRQDVHKSPTTGARCMSTLKKLQVEVKLTIQATSEGVYVVFTSFRL